MTSAADTFTPNLRLRKIAADRKVWADRMNDNLTMLDAVITAFFSTSNMQGVWENSQSYPANCTVVDPDTAAVYVCNVAHTSATYPTTFAEDRTNNPTYWSVYAAPANNRGAWSGPGTVYSANDFVLADGNKYAFCLVNHTSSAAFATDESAGKWSVVIDLTAVGSLVLPVLTAGVDSDKFVITNSAGTSYIIVDGTAAMGKLQGILPTAKGGTGTTLVTGSGSVVFSDAPDLVNPTVTTQAAGNSTTRAASTAYVQSEFALRYGRSLIINGDFAIDQRNEGAAKTLTAGAAIAYTVDRWYASCTGANVTIQRVAGTSPNPYCIRFTGLAANTGVLLGQRIEAANSGPFVNQTLYGSLQAKSSSLTSLTWTAYYANAANNFAAKTSIASGTLTIGTGITDLSFSFNAGSNAGNGIAIEFTGGALLGSQTLQIENVQLEPIQQTKFERLDGALRVERCLRYYEKSYNLGVTPGTVTSNNCEGCVANPGGAVYISTNLRVTKVATPTVVLYSPNSGAAGYIYDNTIADRATSPVAVGDRSFLVVNGATTASNGHIWHYTADAEL